MLRNITTAFTAFTLAGLVSVSAQEQTPPQTQPPAQEAPAPETLTGCVQEAKTTDGGTAYLLSKAQGGSATMYVLNTAQQTELASHVNHKIEVVGQVRQPNPPAEGSPAPDPKVLRPPSVQVESVKMVAETCK